MILIDHNVMLYVRSSLRSNYCRLNLGTQFIGKVIKDKTFVKEGSRLILSNIKRKIIPNYYFRIIIIITVKRTKERQLHRNVINIIKINKHPKIKKHY